MSETFQKNGIPATYLGKRKKSAASNKKKAHHYWQASPFCFVARLSNTLTIPLCGE